jgi:hypothetical protein
MNRAIDTLFYQWVVTEDDKKVPTVFEDITEMDDADKIDGLLTEYANCIASLIEAEVVSRAIVDEKIQQISQDPEIEEEDEDVLAQAIMESDDVKEIQEAVEAAKKELDLLHTSLTKVFSREV